MMMRSGGKRSRRAGVTLLEVLIALVISAMIVLAARFMVEGLSEGAVRLTSASVGLDREANGTDVARALAGRLVMGSSQSMFHGSASRAAFSTYCEVPEGWLEPCRVTLSFRQQGDTTFLGALLETAWFNENVDLVRRRGPLELRYLLSADAGGQWLLIWDGGLTAPLAIGVISRSDTVLLRIGERG